jgi:2'-5' RNA ligase
MDASRPHHRKRRGGALGWLVTDAPLILTAALDDASFAWFDDLRRRHYPADRNQVPAHLTLFHALPAEHQASVAETVARACEAARPMTATVRGPWFLGRGVAYRLASPPLEAFRAGLANAFSPWLTSQDQSAFRPHVTIQNKADPCIARALLEDLQHAFEPFEVEVMGVEIWRYHGGPWEKLGRIRVA